MDNARYGQIYRHIFVDEIAISKKTAENLDIFTSVQIKKAQVTKLNRLSTKSYPGTVGSLFQEMSINATVLVKGVSKPTILKLTNDLGCVCAQFHDRHVFGLRPAWIECYEVNGSAN